MKNLKRKKFADEYLIDMNATRAYVAAGYSSTNPDKNAYKLLQIKEVKDYINKELKKTTDKLEIKREDIIKKAYNIPLLYAEMLELAQRDDLDEDEELRLIRLSNLVKGSDSNKALEILNKMMGFNEPDKLDVTSQGEKITINFNIKKKDD